MKKVFIYGGGFDPVHMGHLALIRSIIRQGGELRLVPAGPHPEGKTYLFSPNQRLLLLKAALGLLDSQDLEALPLDSGLKGSLTSIPPLFPAISICLDELYQKQITYTIHLVERFLEEEPSLDLNLVVGADQASQMHTWKSYQKLQRLVSFWTVPRSGFSPKEGIAWNFLDFSPVSVSSTEIRQLMLAEEGGWEEFLPPKTALLAEIFLKNPLY